MSLRANQLNGFNAGGAVSPLTSIAYQSTSNNGGTLTLTLPSDIVVYDLIIVWSLRVGTLGLDDFTADGFTKIAEATANGTFSTDAAANIWYRIADGSEASQNLTLISGGGNNGSYAYVFRPNGALTSVTVNDVKQEGTTGNPTAGTLNGQSGANPQLLVASYSGTGDVSPRIFSTAADAEFNPSTFNYGKYEILNSVPGGSTSIDMDDEGSNVLLGARLQLA